MNFIFFCPEKQQTFETAEFQLTDNNGVQTDSSGNRYLDARVVLTAPCPYCGSLHEYHATELSCPFQ